MLTAVFGPVGLRIVSVPYAPAKMPVPATTATATAPAPAALSGPLAVIVPPGSFATVFRFALLALVSVSVPRSDPTAAPFGFPNCRRTLRSRLVNSWRSPALSFSGGTSTLDSDVVVETSVITDGGAADAGDTTTAATAMASTRSGASLHGETVA